MDIKIERAKVLKEKPDQNNLGFGQYYTDHMFIMDYETGKGWHDARNARRNRPRCTRTGYS